jgi:signal transduction histidine kinase
MSNSIQAIDESGNIRVISEQKGDRQRIMISDDGPGIAGEIITRIFDPFFTTREDGTGLGLAICRKLSRENNAELTAHNNPDKGCLFSLIIKRSCQ